MIEVYVFNPDCIYGMGMMAKMVGDFLQHKWVTFDTVEYLEKKYVMVIIHHSLSGTDCCDDEGFNIHMRI